MKLRYGAALILLALAGTATALAGGHDNGSPTTGKIGICHHTGKSRAHEWVYIQPDASGVLRGHAGPNHQNFIGPEDIIPPFVLVDAHGVSHPYPGLNMTTRYGADLEPDVHGAFTGAAILAAHCALPTTTTTGTTSTVHTTTGMTTTVMTTTTGHGHGHTTTITTTVPTTVTLPGTTVGTTTVTIPGTTITLPHTTVTLPGTTVTGPVTTVTTPGTTVTSPATTVTVTTTTAVPATTSAPPVTVTQTIPGKTVPGRVRTVTVRKTVKKKVKLISHGSPRGFTG